MANELSLIHHSERLLAQRSRQTEEAQLTHLRSALQTVEPLPGLPHIPLSDFPLPHGASLRLAPWGPLPQLYIEAGISDLVTKRMAFMASMQEPIMELAENYWEKEHVMVNEDHLTSIRSLPSSVQPTYCFKHGYGMCLCNEVGHPINLA